MLEIVQKCPQNNMVAHCGMVGVEWWVWNGGCGVEQLALNESACSDSLLSIYANSAKFGPKFVLLQLPNYIGSRSELRNKSAKN